MEINIKLPRSWSEVSIAMFEELNGIISKGETNPYELTIDIISVLSGTDKTEVRKWPASILNSQELSDSLMFINTVPQKRIPCDKMEIGGVKYKLSLYPQKWSAGQWLDYTTVMKEPYNTLKTPKLIACFTIPEGCEYGDGYDFDETVENINSHMDIETALGLAGFFQLQFSAFTESLAAYSERKMKRLLKSILRQESRSNRKRKVKATEDTPQSGRLS